MVSDPICVYNFFSAGEGLAMNLRWTWVNFVCSLLINRLRFLHDIGLYHLHKWITLHPGEDNHPAARQIDFYVSVLLATTILTLFHLRPLHYGVLLPSMPRAAHVLQDGQVVPLVDLPAQTLTRNVYLYLFKPERDN